MIPNHTFSYIKQNKLVPDMVALSLCYQPILGLPAFSLYHYLVAHYDGGAGRYQFSEILNHLNIGQQVLEQALDLLTGMDLIRLYEQEGRYRVCLQAPLSQRLFLQQPLYRALLSKKIGEYAVEQLESSLPLGDYEVSKSFSTVFGVDGQPLSTSKEVKFDVHSFQQMMARHRLRFANEQEDLVALYHIAETEKMTWVDLFSLVKETAVEGKVSIKRLQTALKAPTLSKDVAHFSSKEQALIRESKSQSALSFLQAIKMSKKATILPSEKKCLQNLAGLGLLDEVINVIVLYTFNKVDSANLNETYAMKLGNDFSYQGIGTAEDALVRLRSDKPIGTGKKNPPNPISTNIPSWSNPHYKDETTEADLRELEKIQQEILANLEKGD